MKIVEIEKIELVRKNFILNIFILLNTNTS